MVPTWENIYLDLFLCACTFAGTLKQIDFFIFFMLPYKYLTTLTPSAQQFVGANNHLSSSHPSGNRPSPSSLMSAFFKAPYLLMPYRTQTDTLQYPLQPGLHTAPSAGNIFCLRMFVNQPCKFYMVFRILPMCQSHTF